MPMRWAFDHANKIVEIVLATEPPSEPEVLRFFDELEAEGGVPYGKLFDATRAVARIDNKIMAIVGQRISTYKNPGPIAIILTEGSTVEGHAKLFMMAVDVDSRARLFRTDAEARAWLEERRLAAHEPKSP